MKKFVTVCSAFAADLIDGDFYHIGLQYLQKEGATSEWTWLDGTRANYTHLNTAPDAPNPVFGQCAQASVERDGSRWYPVPCWAVERSSICELPPWSTLRNKSGGKLSGAGGQQSGAGQQTSEAGQQGAGQQPSGGNGNGHQGAGQQPSSGSQSGSEHVCQDDDPICARMPRACENQVSAIRLLVRYGRECLLTPIPLF